MNKFDFDALLANRRSYAKKSTCVLWVSSSDQFNYVAFPYLYFPGSKNTGNSLCFGSHKNLRNLITMCRDSDVIAKYSPEYRTYLLRTTFP